jgi:c-di-AMP phosphodiesterase-like protein
MRLYFVFLVLFAVGAFLAGPHKYYLLAAEAAIILALVIYTYLDSRRRARHITEFLDDVTSSVSESLDSVQSSFLEDVPLPVLVFNTRTLGLVWANKKFYEITQNRPHLFETRVTDILPEYSANWLRQVSAGVTQNIEVGGRKYRQFGVTHTTVRGDKNAFVVFSDITEQENLKTVIEESRPCCALIVIDNYEEITAQLSEAEKSKLLADVDNAISSWRHGRGFNRRFDRNRYLYFFEKEALGDFYKDRFSVLEKVRVLGEEQDAITPSLSIGIGKDGVSIAEVASFATLALEMALARGGNQVVIRNASSFEFFGGEAPVAEKRSKVKTRIAASSLSKLISAASDVYIMGHKNADFDAIGSAVGIAALVREKGKKPYIVTDFKVNNALALVEKMCALPEYKDVFITAETAIVQTGRNSLLVVTDTSRPDETQYPELLDAVSDIVVIDHHRRGATFIQNAAFVYGDPSASSASELVAELLSYTETKLKPAESDALLTGIILDTKMFTIHTSSRTFETASFLMQHGANTAEVKEFLQSDYRTAIARYGLVAHAESLGGGVAIAVSEVPMTRVVIAQAADELLNISEVKTSFVIAPCLDNPARPEQRGATGNLAKLLAPGKKGPDPRGFDIAVSARSIGEVNVQLCLEKLGGGGNAAIAGAMIPGSTAQEVRERLVTVIEEYRGAAEA